MKISALLTISTYLLLSAACSPNSEAQTKKYANDPVREDGTLPKAKHAPRHIKINPNRKEHYQVTINTKNAPVSFNFGEGFESYTAHNCRYITNIFAGATGSPDFYQDLKVQKISNDTYGVDFYTDTPLDEDYYGKGLCHWQLNTIHISLAPTGNMEKEMILAVNFDPEDLNKLNSKNPTKHMVKKYRKEDFPVGNNNEEFAGLFSHSLSKENMQAWNIKPEDVFPVEIWIRKVEK